MRAARLIPALVGLMILLFGVYLVSTHGYVGGTYLPSVIGIQPCGSGSSPNATPCTGIGSYGGFGVGTIVCLFGIGLLASSLRGAMATSASGMGASRGIPPEMLAAIAQAQARPPVAPGAIPNTVYCSKCGAANPSEAKFCHQCATGMQGAAPAAPPPNP
jgi:ribosomal protein L40E